MTMLGEITDSFVRRGAVVDAVTQDGFEGTHIDVSRVESFEWNGRQRSCFVNLHSGRQHIVGADRGRDLYEQLCRAVGTQSTVGGKLPLNAPERKTNVMTPRPQAGVGGAVPPGLVAQADEGRREAGNGHHGQ